MAERGLDVDHSMIARCVLHFGPILEHLIRHEMRRPNRSWRVDETYIRVAGRWTYLYRAIDSAGNIIDFLLSPNRDLVAAKAFLQLALSAAPVRPRVINADGHPVYATAIAELKESGELSAKCHCRPSPYLNNIIEQDHRVVKKRITASQGFRSVEGALSTIAGYETMNIIRKGQIRWLVKVKFSARTGSLSACSDSRPNIAGNCSFTGFTARHGIDAILPAKCPFLGELCLSTALRRHDVSFFGAHSVVDLFATTQSRP